MQIFLTLENAQKQGILLPKVNNPAASNRASNLQRCKQRGMDPRGSRQISAQVRLLGSLLAGIKKTKRADATMEWNQKMHIMLVEDDAALAEQIVLFLGKWGYRISALHAFEDVLAQFQDISPQLILLDVNLPYYDGFYWCRRIREVSDVPIIYISSRSGDADKIMAIAQGGDDYVEKPFRLEILKAKIEAILRRTYQYKVKERIYLRQEVYFEPNRSMLVMHGQTLGLTKSEKRILTKLLECRPEIVTREDFMMELWSTDEFVSDGTLTTLISRLRGKLLDFCKDEIIKTKKGQGYYIE